MEYINFLRQYLRNHSGKLTAYARHEVELRMYMAAIWAEEQSKKELREAVKLMKSDEYHV